MGRRFILAVLVLAVFFITASPAQASPALRAVHRWVNATHAENLADARPLLKYHHGAERCAYPAKRCRWKIAIQWHRNYRHAAKQRALIPNGPQAVQIGFQVAYRMGVRGAQWRCLYALGSRESGWVVTKYNYAGSGAYGIPQALPGSKMASHGANWRYSAAVQVSWMIDYVNGRYGSACAADAFQAANGWY